MNQLHVFYINLELNVQFSTEAGVILGVTMHSTLRYDSVRIVNHIWLSCNQFQTLAYTVVKDRKYSGQQHTYWRLFK